MFAKVFNQIFDSSVANDPAVRHMFMDLLVLADSDGMVDMTQEAIAARTRMPLDEVNRLLALLAEPDVNSRTPDHNGARIILLDGQHRNWGWQIVNYRKYREIRSEDARKEYMRNYMRKKRAGLPTRGLTYVNSVNTGKLPLAKAEAEAEGTLSKGKFKKPSIEEAKLHAAKLGLPDTELSKFMDYYESNGWRVGKNPMKSWTATMNRWKTTWEERRYASPPPLEQPELTDAEIIRQSHC